MAVLTIVGVLAPQVEAATLGYANNWNYVVPSGVTLSGTNYFASTNDLANAGQSTLLNASWSGGSSGSFGSSPAELNNGFYAAAELIGGVPNGFVNAASTATTLLATPNSTYTINFTTGMDLTSLDVYAAMTGTTRAKQNWSLAYRLAGEESYQDIVSPFLALNVAQNSNGNRQGAWYNKTTLTLASGELLNVGSLRFTFLTPVYYAPTDGANSTMDPTGYREIDVFGDYGDLTWNNAAGNMTWNTASTNWTAGGAGEVWENPKAATLSTTGAGTITVSGTNTINGLTVSADGYTLTGGQINLGLASTILAISNSAVIESVVGGSNALVKTGSATLTLSGSNSHTGAVSVRAGVLNLSSTTGAAAGSVSGVTVMTNATLLVAQNNQVNDSAAVTLSGGTIRTAAGVSEVFGNLLVETPSFLEFGAGAAGAISFGTYTPSARLTINNFAFESTLIFKNDLSDSITNSSLFAFSNGGIGSYSWNQDSSTFTITAIPEPTTVLVAVGLLGLLLWPSRRRLFKA